MERKRVGVIFGSRSVEHEVSIVTAHQIMAVLSERHEVVPIYITREGRWLTGAGLNDLEVYRNGKWEEVGDELQLSLAPGGGFVVQLGPEAAPVRGGLRGVLGSKPTEPPGWAPLKLDVVVPAVHGTFGEDGTLQGLLELADIPYTGSGVTASAVGLDKIAMRNALKAHGLPVVDALIIEGLDEITYGMEPGGGNGGEPDEERLNARHQTFQESIDEVDATVRESLGYPVFVKPVTAGSSVGIAKATDRASLQAALEIAANYDSRALVERSMEGCVEVNCSVLGGIGYEPRVSLCEQPVAWTEFLSFEDKYMRGGKSGSTGAKEAGMASLDRRIPAPIPEDLTHRVQENALVAFQAIGASGVARIDAFVREETGETWVMEINTMPGSFAFYLWEQTGKSFAELADDLIHIAVETHRARTKLMYTFESGMLDRMGGTKTS